ncbi:MAG: hypothetical protein MUC72_01585 [Acidobacteria bacterium]|jgi:hypothetical protein|nr:hypothetical protein [Acidobacteriota bacterium]
MNIRSSWPLRLLFFSLILCAAAVHADAGGPLKFTSLLGEVAAGAHALGVPDVKIRPVFAPGSRAKSQMRFNINVLCVEL